MNKKNITLLIIFLIIWNIVLTVLFVNNKSLKQTITEENVYGISTDLTKVAQDCYSSVVGIKSSYGNQTGIIYKQEDLKTYIITTYHGIGNDNTVSVTFANNKTLAASLLGYDFKSDVAVLVMDCPYKLNIVKCGDNEHSKIGEFIICICSNPDKASNDVELGIISNSMVNITDTVIYNKNNYNIQKDMLALSLYAIKGYSGSPIFNMKKEVIGLVQVKDDEKVYSLTVNELKILADKIIKNEEVNKIDFGFKGKFIKNLEDYERNMLNIPLEITNGYYISNVQKNSLANKLNILNSDIIVSINNISINTQKDLLNILYSDINEVLISLYRDKNLIEIKGYIND